MEKSHYNNCIDSKFCARDTVDLARDVLGCKLHRRLSDGSILSGIIVETEAYKQSDPACHAYRGKTKRSITLFKSPGLAYVYFIYGMYHCLNIVAEPENHAGAVLIRALEPLYPLENTNGPGKLCRALNITKDHNEQDLTSSKSDIWITFDKEIPHNSICQTTRIGIKQAKDLNWRFFIKNNKFVSIK